MECYLCGKILPENTEICDNCGAPQHRPAPPEEPAAPQVPAAPAKKKFPWLALCIPLALLALILVLLALPRSTGSALSYRMTAQTLTSELMNTTQHRWAYDSQGRLIAWDTIVSGGSLSSMPSTETQLRYEYDPQGLLTAVRADHGYLGGALTTTEVLYSYENGILSAVDIPTREGCTVEISEEGRIERVRISENAAYATSESFQYHTDGALKQQTLLYSSEITALYSSTFYDRLGRVTQSCSYSYLDGELLSLTVYDYDGDSPFPCKIVSANTRSSTTRTTQIHTVYEGQQLTALTIEIQGWNEGVSYYEAAISGPVVWSGLAAQWTPDTATGDLGEFRSFFDESLLELEFRKDLAGNLVFYEIRYDDRVNRSMEATYEAVTQSQLDAAPAPLDPMFTLSWLGLQ